MTKTEVKHTLLPCPFCGFKPIFSEGWTAPAGVGTTWGYTITCKSKKCKIHPQLSAYERFNINGYDEVKAAQMRSEVVSIWNNREG